MEYTIENMIIGTEDKGIFTNFGDGVYFYTDPKLFLEDIMENEVYKMNKVWYSGIRHILLILSNVDFDKFDKLANIYDVYHNSHRETNKHNQLTVDNINNNVSIKNMVIDDDLGDVAFTTTLS